VVASGFWMVMGCRTQKIWQRPFISFCERNSPLKPLLCSERGWREFCLKYDKSVIEGAVPGRKCFVDLRAWGSDWFKGLVGLTLEG
jgi:hypothetical protein